MLTTCYGSRRKNTLQRRGVTLDADDALTAYLLLSRIVDGGRIDYEGASRLRDVIRAHLPDVSSHTRDDTMLVLPDMDIDVATFLRLQLGMAGNKRDNNSLSGLHGLLSSGDVCIEQPSTRVLHRLYSAVVRGGGSGKGIPRDLDAAVDTDWSFDVMQLNCSTDGHALSLLATHLIRKCGAIAEFCLDEQKVSICMRAIESGYRVNPYHNSVHAACVLQHTHMFLNSMGIVNAYVRVVAYMAAIIHDYDHIGLTNAYLVNAGHTLAITHNDTSPMENHSLHSVFRLMAADENNFLAELPQQTMRDFRRDVIALVMATDMTRHLAYRSRFCAAHSAADNGRRDSMEPRMRDVQFALKCADLGHTFLPIDQHVRWVALLEQEYFLQGDLEKSRGMPITPLFDRSKPGITRSQMGFFEIVVLPTLSVFTRVYPKAAHVLTAAVANAKHWWALHGDPVDENTSTRISQLLLKLDDPRLLRQASPAGLFDIKATSLEERGVP
jgi:cAMP-specific phosphodiesterase 4/high affinity cAMP-specific and IBMX-insensitive 3',5'-cyclic phosphodiesterase 8